jgi:hypothetical protein
MCNFTLFVTTDTYSQYYTELCNHAQNAQNVCNCSQGPKVPALIIPYVNAPGPGQTIAEWHSQQSANIPYYRTESGAEMGEMTEAEMQQAYALQQQQAAYEQQQHAYAQQQQGKPSQQQQQQQHYHQQQQYYTQSQQHGNQDAQMH